MLSNRALLYETKPFSCASSSYRGMDVQLVNEYWGLFNKRTFRPDYFANNKSPKSK